MAPHSSQSIYNTPERSLVMKTVVMAPHGRSREGDLPLSTSLSGDTRPNILEQKLKFKTIKNNNFCLTEKLNLESKEYNLR